MQRIPSAKSEHEINSSSGLILLLLMKFGRKHTSRRSFYNYPNQSHIAGPQQAREAIHDGVLTVETDWLSSTRGINVENLGIHLSPLWVFLNQNHSINGNQDCDISLHEQERYKNR
jgi:hypothetical protein